MDLSDAVFATILVDSYGEPGSGDTKRLRARAPAGSCSVSVAAAGSCVIRICDKYASSEYLHFISLRDIVNLFVSRMEAVCAWMSAYPVRLGRSSARGAKPTSSHRPSSPPDSASARADCR